jgi:predicted small secreted protein
MKKAFFFALVLLGTALLLASGNTPALGKDILLQGMLHNKFNVIDGDKDEIVATIETRGK